MTESETDAARVVMHSSLAEAMTIVLALGLVAVLVSLIYRHRMSGSRINLEDYLLGDDGRVSKKAFVLFGAFLLSSWVIAFRTLTGTLTDEAFAGYLLAWVAPTVTALWKTPTAPPEKPDAS